MQTEKGNGSEWLTRRIDRMESEIDKLHEDIRRIRDDERLYREHSYTDIKNIERSINELPEITKHYQRQRGVRDGAAFIGRIILMLGAVATAVFTIWSIFGDLYP